MYTLNSVNIATYGIIAGHAPGSNIALTGCYDLPARIGKAYHEWADEDSVEPYVLADEITFEGRDITFYGTITGSRDAVSSYLTALYNAVDLFTDTVVFSTSYGNFNVLIKEITPERFLPGAKITILMREPVVTLTGGSLPSTGTSNYTIDNIPISSFGLYYSKGSRLYDLPETKEQFFTRYAAEGYQMTQRKNNIFEFSGFVANTTLSGFILNIKALYLLFSSAGLRNMKLNDVYVTCFLTSGFQVKNIRVLNGLIIANFNAEFLSTSTRTQSEQLQDNTGDPILTEAEEGILV